MKNIDIAKKELQEFLNERGAKLGYSFSFPRYNILPDEVKLALLVLGKHDMRVIIEINTKEKKQSPSK